MKKSMFVLIAAAIIVYGLYKLIKAIKAVARYVRIQRMINKAMDYMTTEEYRKSVDEQAARVIESLGL